MSDTSQVPEPTTPATESAGPLVTGDDGAVRFATVVTVVGTPKSSP